MTEIYIEIDGEIKAVTDKALLFAPEDGRDEAWVPKSQCGKVSESKLDALSRGDRTILFVTEWIAQQKDWA